MILNQAGYINKIPDSFKMSDSECTQVSTPLPLKFSLGLLDCPDEVDSKSQAEHSAIEGSLLYLYQWTRFDMGFAVTFLSRYLSKLGLKHLQAG